MPIFALIWCLLTGSLGLFGLLLSILVSVIFFDKKFNLSHILSIFLAIIIKLPKPNLPDYPGDAVLVPLSEVANHTVFSVEHFFRFINNANYQIILNQSILVIVLCLIFWLMTFRPNLNSRPFLFYLFIVFLTFLGELSGYSFMPFKFFYRVVPGIAMLPFVWDLALVFFTSTIVIALNITKREYNYVSYVVFFFLISGVIFIKPPKLAAEISKGMEQTPSSYVIDYWGDSIFKLKDKKYTKLIPNRDFNYQVEANLNQQEAINVFDSNLNSRWSSKRIQQGGEVFKVSLNNPLRMGKVVIDAGKTHTDFPRGFKIEIIDEAGNSKIIFNKADWIGPVRFTEKGYPYFGPQSRVEVPINDKVKTLIITQIGKDTFFHWSIAELEFYREN